MISEVSKHSSQTLSLQHAVEFLNTNQEQVRWYAHHLKETDGNLFQFEDYLMNLWGLSETVAQDAAAVIWDGLL